MSERFTLVLPNGKTLVCEIRPREGFTVPQAVLIEVIEREEVRDE